MIGTICVECQAQNPNMPLYPWTAFVNSPSSIRVRNVPKKIGSWCITRVYVSVVYPDGQIKTADCIPVGGVYVGTVDGADVSGTTENGYTIFADGIDENGNAVTGYILGRGNVTILDDEGTLKPDAKRYYVRMLSAESETHYEGDLYPTESGYVIWQDGEAHLLGTPFEQITAYVENAVSVKADLSTLDDYAKTDELSSKADLSAIPSNTSQLSNDSGFITSAEVLPYHNLTTPTVNTGLADKAYYLALSDSKASILDGYYVGQHTFTRDLEDKFAFGALFITYWPYLMTMFNGQTYDPPLEMKFCQDTLTFMRAGRPRQIYSGWMFRTGGAGVAIPCSEDGTPTGTLYETTAVQADRILVASDTPHTIGFTPGLNDPYGGITSLDGEPNISASRQTHAKTNYVTTEVANKSELPAKTSELSNDSGYITSADIPTQTYIEDTIGNKIEADLDCWVADLTTPWTLADNSEVYTLTYNSDNVDWEYINGTNVKVTLRYYEMSGSWDLVFFVWGGEETGWVPAGGYNVEAPYNATSLSFPNNWRATRTVLSQKKLATEEYVDSLIAALEARIAALEGN